MEIIILALVSILVMFLIIRGAVYQGTLDTLKDFEDYMSKKEKDKTE